MEAVRLNDDEAQRVFRLWEPARGAEMSRLQIDLGRCWNAVTGRSRCKVCVDLCPEQCLSLDPAVALDADRCTGCGLCAAQCPTGAIHLPAQQSTAMLDAMSRQFADAEVHDGTAILTCPSQPRDPIPQASVGASSGPAKTPQRSQPVTCLAALSDAHLRHLLRLGARRVVLDTGPCAGCRIEDGEQRVKQRAASARAWGQTLGLGQAIDTGPQPESGSQLAVPLVPEPKMSRRDLFRRVTTRVSQPVASERSGSAGAGLPGEPRSVPARRAMLLQMGPDRPERLHRTPDPRWLGAKMVSTTAECILCNSCSRLCPSGALQQDDDSSRSVLRFDLLRCMGCPQCEQLCPHGALRSRPLVAGDFPARAERVVFGRRRVPCRRCERPMPAGTGDDVCPACQKLTGVDDSMRSILGW